MINKQQVETQKFEEPQIPSQNQVEETKNTPEPETKHEQPKTVINKRKNIKTSKAYRVKNISNDQYENLTRKGHNLRNPNSYLKFSKSQSCGFNGGKSFLLSKKHLKILRKILMID